MNGIVKDSVYIQIKYKQVLTKGGQAWPINMLYVNTLIYYILPKLSIPT